MDKKNSHIKMKNARLWQDLQTVRLSRKGSIDDFNRYPEDYALRMETILELQELFKDEPSAEELCAMLTK